MILNHNNELSPMKIPGLYITGIVLLFLSACGPIEKDNYASEVKDWQSEWNETFSDTAVSPLPDSMVTEFNGLKFFPIDDKYRVEADFKLTPYIVPFIKTRNWWRTKSTKIICSFLIKILQMVSRPTEEAVTSTLKYPGETSWSLTSINLIIPIVPITTSTHVPFRLMRTI